MLLLVLTKPKYVYYVENHVENFVTIVKVNRYTRPSYFGQAVVTIALVLSIGY